MQTIWKQVCRTTEVAEINIWEPDSRLGSGGRTSHVGVNIAADKEGGNIG